MFFCEYISSIWRGKLEQKRQFSRESLKKIIYILIIIIIILILLLVWKIGRIGIDERPTSGKIYVDGIAITEDDIEIEKDTQLNIFNNEKFKGEKIIAPHSQGTYKFYIRNKSNRDINYNIKFSDEMKKFVNMKYRLKIDNIYIRGNEECYTTIEKLDVDNITVPKDSINMFTLEWYWEDNDELDTKVGTSDERYYTINLKIEAFKD